MTVSDALSAAEFRAALERACDRIIAARDELIALDSAAGDGDLGVTLSTGFGAVRQFVATQPEEDLGKLLSQIGMQLGRSAPSTMGTLLATGFLRAGAAIKGHASLSAVHIADMLEAAEKGIRERGQAEPGQRTVLDALVPSAEAARQAAGEGASASVALARAAEAAAHGADATAEMQAQVGRAGWLADRARGHRDGGAVAWSILLAGLANVDSVGGPGQRERAGVHDSCDQ